MWDNDNEETQRLIQRELDFLDEEIDTMERSKSKAGDPDTASVKQAKHHQQRARERFSKGDIRGALYGIHCAKTFVFFGEKETDKYVELYDRVKSALSSMENS